MKPDKDTLKLKRGNMLSVQPVAMALGRELLEAGLVYRREAQGHSDGETWDDINDWQKAGWQGVGIYVAKHFKRK